jgi:hypothetical protein
MLAPVLICTLNRYDHFVNCLISLNECRLAEDTIVYIGLDYPRNEFDVMGYNLICNFLQESNFIFKELIIVKRATNYGINRNWSSMRSLIFEKFDKLIMSEDDNVFSTDFLNFVNQALETFKTNSEIFSISGYGYPIEINTTEICYKWMGHSAWGCGIWRDKWLIAESDSLALVEVDNFFKKFWLIRGISKYSTHYLSAVNLMVRKRVLKGDSYVIMKQFESRQVSVFPFVSRVRNNGHDGSGANSISNNRFEKQFLYEGESNYIIPVNLVDSNDTSDKLYTYFHIGHIQMFKEIMKYIFLWFKLVFKVEKYHVE